MFSSKIGGLAFAARSLGALGTSIKTRLEQITDREKLRLDQKDITFFGGEPDLPLPQALADAVRSAKESVVIFMNTISNNGSLSLGHGSGFVVGDDGLVLTARHVMRGKKTVNAITKGKHYRVSLLGEDRKNDLSLVRLLPALATEEPHRFKSLLLSDEELFRGRLVAGLGFPLKVKYQVSVGTYLAEFVVPPDLALPDALAEGILFDGLWDEGGSGGPIITEKGVVALAAAMEITGERRLMAVGCAELQEFLAANRYNKGTDVPFHSIED